jgi:hypothetical protein
MQSSHVERGRSFSVYVEFDINKPRRSGSEIQLFLIHCAHKHGVWNHPRVKKLVERDAQRRASEKTQPIPRLVTKEPGEDPASLPLRRYPSWSKTLP